MNSRRWAFRPANRLLVSAAALLFGVAETGAHNLDQQNTFINFEPTTVAQLKARADAGQVLIQSGDVVSLICKSTPGPGTAVGASGYLTFFIPAGTQVVNVEYVVPDGVGGFVGTAIKPPAAMPLGNGPIAAAASTSLIGLQLGPNITGQSALTVSSSGVHQGTIAGIYGDTGIFYSTDPATGFGTFAAAGGYDGKMWTSDDVLTNNSGERFVPLTKWDASQLIAFGISKPSAPVVDPNGRGSTPWGMGSPVAGPQSGYQWCFNWDYWLTHPSDSNRMKNSIATGPWKRIRQPGSTVSKDQPGSQSAMAGTAVEDASNLGLDVASGSPLPPTLSLTDNTSPKAIRLAYGEMKLGRSEHVRIQLKVLAGQGQAGSPFNSQGGIEMMSDAFGGDAGGDSNGKDHPWRYVDSNPLTQNTSGMLQKHFAETPLLVGTDSYFDLTIINTGVDDLNDVVITDPMPTGLTYLSAVPAPVSTSPLRWNLGTVPAQSVVNIRVNFRARQVATIFNTASMSSSRGVRMASDSVDVRKDDLVIYPPPIDPDELYVGIGNLVFEDRNGNGRADAGEGIDGVTVQLFDEAEEAAHAGDLSSANPLRTTVTANGGRYRFSGLAPGTYVVHLPASQFGTAGALRGLFSLPGLSNGDDDQGEDGEDSQDPWITGITSRDVALNLARAPTALSGETGTDSTADDAAYDANVDLTIDFGLYRAVAVGNLVFHDLNGNGHADTGEGMDGITVELYRGSDVPEEDVPLDTTITSNGGLYLFTGLSEGAYRVHIPAAMFTANAPLSSMISIPSGQAGDDNVGEDGIAGGSLFSSGVSSGTVNLYPGLAPTAFTGETGIDSASDNFLDAAVDLTVDFGFQNPLGVGNLVFIDANTNGHYDVGEGIAGVTVDLYRTGDTPGSSVPLETQTTDTAGHYFFDYVPTGSYFIHVRASNFAAGMPLAGKVSLTGAGTGFGDDDVDENGLDDLSPNINGIRSASFTLGDNAEPATAQGETGFLNGEDSRDDNNYDLTIDFGFKTPDPNQVGVGNAVFLDANRNHVFDSGEGVDGVVVRLFTGRANPAVDQPLATTTTAGGGFYFFANLMPGSYFIQIPASMFASGAPLFHALSLPGQGGDNQIDDQQDENGDDSPTPATTGIRSTVFALSPDTEPVGTGSEFGRNAFSDDIDDDNADLTIDFGFYRPVGVGNLVFVDANRNGVFNAGEGIDGVKVELYTSIQSPGFDTALKSTVTAGGGFYLFSNLVPGQYVVHIPTSNFAPGAPLAAFSPLVGQGGDDGVDDDFDENGSDPALAFAEGVSSLIVDLTSGGEPTDATTERGAGAATDNADDSDYDLTVDFGFYAAAPSSFAQWQAQNPLGGQNGATVDPDGDGVANLIEYATGLSPTSGVLAWNPFELKLNSTTNQLDAWMRKAVSATDLTITLQGLVDLAQSPGGWFDITTITPEFSAPVSGVQTVQWSKIEQFAAFSGGQGFVRLRVGIDANHDGIPETSVVSDVWGWVRRTLPAQIGTFSNPFLKAPVFSGVVASVSGNTLSFAAASDGGSIQSAMIGAAPYYVEVVDGTSEGQRFEVDESSSAATTIALAPGDPLSTATTVPASLVGSRIVLRPHWTMKEQLPPARFVATTSSSSADRVMLYNGTAFSTTWLFSNFGAPKWVNDASLVDRGSRVMAPGEAILVQPRFTSAPSLLNFGMVRVNKFACPIKQGTRLVGGGWPMDQTPASRGMLVSDGFTGSNTTTRADRFQLWSGDATPGGSSYETHYLLKTATLQQWVKSGDASLKNENLDPLFKSMRGVYVNSVLGKADYTAPLPWVP